MLTCIRPQLCPIIVWHGKAAFTNIRFWGHVVSVVLFFNKCHWAWFQGTRETKCVAAHARCVSFATPKTWQKMFPMLFQYHFRERHARVEISTLWVSFAFNVWQIHSNLPILGLINVLDMFWAQTLRHPNLCVANLLGEVCPIFQKFSDFRCFLEVGSSLCAFMSPGGSVEMLWRWNAAGAVHCLWRSLRAQHCMFGQLGRLGARSAPGSPEQETKRSDWIRLNQPHSAWP